MTANKYIKTLTSVILLGLAVVRWAFHDVAFERMDTVFLGLIMLAILVCLVPWENVKTFKAAGIELSLEQSSVKAAITRLGLGRIEDKHLREQLSRLGDEIQAVRGGRVLWIDDYPHKIVGERRLLRALGIQVVSAISSEMAEKVLDADNDFDLIISDVQRVGGSYLLTDGVDVHEGTNFVIKLREHPDPTIRVMPVVFYAAYPWDSLVKFTRPAREIQPEPEISNTVIDFVPKVVKQLARLRATPIEYSPKKDPTSVRWQMKAS